MKIYIKPKLKPCAFDPYYEPYPDPNEDRYNYLDTREEMIYLTNANKLLNRLYFLVTLKNTIEIYTETEKYISSALVINDTTDGSKWLN
jgi:hypothetical protein